MRHQAQYQDEVQAIPESERPSYQQWLESQLHDSAQRITQVDRERKQMEHAAATNHDEYLRQRNKAERLEALIMASRVAVTNGDIIRVHSLLATEV